MPKMKPFHLLLCLGLPFILFQGAFADSFEDENPESDYYQVTSVTLPDGQEVDQVVISGPPKPPPGTFRETIELLEAAPASGINLITSIPAFDWSYGCSATSAAMIAGYYDRNGYPDMYAGPTHGGIMPMTNAYWGGGECPLSATHKEKDGLSSLGHVDDYWITYGSSADDPYIDNWDQHTHADCTGDFMKTNQSAYGNDDGSTTFYSYSTSNNPLTCSTMETSGIHNIDGTYGFKLFYESRGYEVTTCYNQKTRKQGPSGFMYEDFKAEIDAGRPVMVHLAGHTVVGFGYDEPAGDIIFIHDTWDYSSHTMV
jgi:hypothetical protein